MRKPAVRLSFVRPMEPEPTARPPKGDGWSHEIKFAGYRTQIIKDAHGIRLFTKTGIDWTSKYRPIAEEAEKLEAETFIIEGEVIVTDSAGLSQLQSLHSAITRRPQDLYLMAFDLLHFKGYDLCNMALVDRREMLQVLIPIGGHIQFSETLPGHGEAALHLACEAGLGGHCVEAAGQCLSQRPNYELAQDYVLDQKNESRRGSACAARRQWCCQPGAIAIVKLDPKIGSGYVTPCRYNAGVCHWRD